MTDNEIISALEVFLKAIRISGEQYIDISAETLAGALNLIYNLQADKEALNAGQETLQKALAAKIAEVERFKKIETTVNEFWCVLQKFTKEKLKEKPTLEELLEYIEHAKAEAIKEFAERLKEKMVDMCYAEDAYIPYPSAFVDNLEKEMVGDAE